MLLLLLQGNVTQMEDALLRACMLFSNLSYTATSAVVCLVGAFASGQGDPLSRGSVMPFSIKLLLNGVELCYEST